MQTEKKSRAKLNNKHSRWIGRHNYSQTGVVQRKWDVKRRQLTGTYKTQKNKLRGLQIWGQLTDAWSCDGKIERTEENNSSLKKLHSFKKVFHKIFNRIS